MRTRICICCGEPMSPENRTSGNPNMCAFCSRMVDGMDENRLPADEPTRATRQQERPSSQTAATHMSQSA